VNERTFWTDDVGWAAEDDDRPVPDPDDELPAPPDDPEAVDWDEGDR
jgi:hypothetical protein